MMVRCSVSTLLLAIMVDGWAFCSRADEADRPVRCVRVVYLVSADREEVPEYAAALDHAIRDVQRWYGRQLGGPTFRLHDPVVE
ncbi:MAG: hypothetical protein HN380_21535, partial [Victivallales bacterium]|nr:hypothetical protein [Victivallales bacterium]